MEKISDGLTFLEKISDGLMLVSGFLLFSFIVNIFLGSSIDYEENPHIECPHCKTKRVVSVGKSKSQWDTKTHAFCKKCNSRWDF